MCCFDITLLTAAFGVSHFRLPSTPTDFKKRLRLPQSFWACRCVWRFPQVESFKSVGTFHSSASALRGTPEKKACRYSSGRRTARKDEKKTPRADQHGAQGQVAVRICCLSYADWRLAGMHTCLAYTSHCLISAVLLSIYLCVGNVIYLAFE